ncbi:MAG: hypothetical protein GY940_00535, partial [bacterium]|nr:hypothetical protein [bacterium]
LWVGTDAGGLNKLDKTSGQFIQYRHDSQNPHSLSNNSVQFVCEDRSGMLWVGTFGGGLNKFDKKSRKFSHYYHDPHDPNSLSHNNVLYIYEDRSRALWIGTYGGGLNKLDQNRSQFTHYQHRDADPQSLSNNDVRTIYQDRSGALWIGTWGGGLNKFDKQSGGFTRFQHDPGDPHSLSYDIVRSIYEDRSGTLWVGTNDGLNKFDPANKKFRSYHEKDGLPSKVIYGILEDRQGNLWLSTNKGLSRFNPQNRTFINYDVEDGLQNNEFNGGASFRNSKGEMFFGGSNGFNSFFPQHITGNRNSPNPSPAPPPQAPRDGYKPPVVLTDFLLFNQSVPLQRLDEDSPLQNPIHETHQLTLSYKDSMLSFKFAVLDYTDPGRNRYKYKLENLNEDWIETDAKNRYATYTNLTPGSYVFRVKGCNKDGMWNEEGVSLKLKIQPPPWATWWAYTLYLALLIAVVLRFLRSKRILERKVRDRTWELEKKNKMLIETQEQLAQSEKMAGLGTLVAGVAHEINNPVNFTHAGAFNLDRDLREFKSFLVELAGDEADNEILAAFDEKFSPLFKHIGTMREGTHRIKEIVRDLRRFSRLDEAHMKSVKLLEGLESTYNLVKANYNDSVDFVCDFGSNPQIECYPAELNQVFMNLMVNGCQAIIQKQKKNLNNRNETPSRGTLTLQTLQRDGNAVIRFEDTGIGMSREVRRKIFDPFFTTKAVGEGTGLGLSISFGIVRRHGGRFEVQSKEGKGTVISLFLPLKQTKEDPSMVTRN